MIVHTGPWLAMVSNVGCSPTTLGVCNQQRMGISERSGGETAIEVSSLRGEAFSASVSMVHLGVHWATT